MNNTGALVITIRDGEGVNFIANGEEFNIWFKWKDGHMKLLVNADKQAVKVKRLTERAPHETPTNRSV